MWLSLLPSLAPHYIFVRSLALLTLVGGVNGLSSHTSRIPEVSVRLLPSHTPISGYLTCQILSILPSRSFSNLSFLSIPPALESSGVLNFTPSPPQRPPNWCPCSRVFSYQPEGSYLIRSLTC